MIERYQNREIARIWSDENKLLLWQKVELAVILAREQLGTFPKGVHEKFKEIFLIHPIDIAWWKERDKEINHDLNAFIDERLRYLPLELHQYWHKGMTSYDTEEPAFSLLLKESVEKAIDRSDERIKGILGSMAKKYRYTPMLGRTHGQEAKLQTFGKRCLTWKMGFVIAYDQMLGAYRLVSRSKLSGAIGNYQGLTPEEEEATLKILGLTPFVGATQIMPRMNYVPLANALELVVASLAQIAEDIRLSARSGNPIMQEPFGKKQKGSSAMPHKKNTITCEQQIGMLTMARNFAQMLRERAITWEERAIEQSCVERIAWPDLFHVVMQSFKNMIKILDGLQVFPDNMLIEIINSKGCYASEDAKDWLKEKFAARELSHEDAYRIVQLASFLVHQVDSERQKLRDNPPKSLDEASQALSRFVKNESPQSIEFLILHGELTLHSELAATQEEIDKWNGILKLIFSDHENIKSWTELFSISYPLRNEPHIFKCIIGE